MANSMMYTLSVDSYSNQTSLYGDISRFGEKYWVSDMGIVAEKPVALFNNIFKPFISESKGTILSDFFPTSKNFVQVAFLSGTILNFIVVKFHQK